MPDDPEISRVEGLLADRALQGLTDEEWAELKSRIDDPDAESLSLELTAAEVELVLGKADQGELPDSLRRKLERGSVAHFAAQSPPTPLSIASRIVPWLGWVVATAALVFVYLSRDSSLVPIPINAGPTLVERLAGVAPRPLSHTNHPLARGGSGALVWSGERQEGYLAIRGLAENQKDRGVYQLWIFDATRDERFPIDGGTFTVNDPGTTTLVPIHPSLVVRRPTLFAVTLEPPGGVVVSDRKRILLTAPIEP